MIHLAAVFGAVIISFSAILFALSGLDPASGAFFRMLYAVPLLAAIWWARRGQDHRPASRRWMAFGAGVALGLDVVAWNASIELIGAGLATLVANSQVIFVAVAAWALQGEKPSRPTMVAIPVVLVGVAMVSGIGQANPYGDNPILGAALGLLAAALYATFILVFRKSNEARVPVAGPLLEATTGAMISSLMFGLLGPGIDFDITWPAHGWILVLAIGPQVLGWLFIGYAMPRLPAVETATVVLTQPALTIVWGAMIFDERPSAIQIAGVVVVLLGVTTVTLMRSRRPTVDGADAARA